MLNESCQQEIFANCIIQMKTAENVKKNTGEMDVPELPEMENYRRLLSRFIINRPITAVHITREKSINMPSDAYANLLMGERIEKLSRRAKYLIFHLSNGNVLLLHLMLGGMLAYGSEKDKPDRTVQVAIKFGNDSLYCIGLRLGFIHLLSEQEAMLKLAKLGPEPLEPDFTPDTLQQVLQQRKGILKPVLVNQERIAGIGNCYADEICFAAGVLPTRSISTLQKEEVERLYTAMISTLQDAIRHGGYMEMPLFPGDQLTGTYDEMCKVYDCGEEPCVRCSHPIRMDEVNGRKCFYCPHCQK